MSTYLLVHGAWHTGEAWDRVVPLLERAGHRVLAPTLTGYGATKHLAGPEIGLDTHIDDVAGLITSEHLTDVVLVGHSYAGMVISGVADRVPERIRELVFLDAMVPEDGETAVDVMPVSQALVDAALESESGWRVPPLPEFPGSGLFGVTDPEDIAWVRTMLSDQPVDCLRQPVRLGDPAAKALPRTHIHCTVGKPEGYERRAVPQGEPVWELETGHDCMVTRPAELTELLLKIG
ncbi:alpha/beta hydrolase [Amycolatopsis acidicola]|uniref:Alpha/beta hydrolase n=1 Tax=Amycolatopsis acidicola TaxID=2596893 RepID=A0A5N0UY79_9PSEU|nr:alpha/beta hydrolase [Amycolatopsis acidicola]KAA9156325.1 alpha/beta hydrolase [Amycolatopsis acidicola]